MYNTKSNCPSTDPWWAAYKTGKAPETPEFVETEKVRELRCNPDKNSITESKPMREMFRENRMIDSIKICKKIQQAKTCDCLMADGLSKVIIDSK